MIRRAEKTGSYSYGYLEGKKKKANVSNCGAVNNAHVKFTCCKRMPVIIFCFRITNLVP